MKKDKHLKIKEKICDNLIGKKFEIVWKEEVEYATSVFAVDEEDAYEKWNDGNHPTPNINSSQIVDSGWEIMEIPEMYWRNNK